MSSSSSDTERTAPIIPVILAGGVGTRLWPISRGHFPKQFHKLFDANSLMQNTLLRACEATAEPPIIVCNEEHRFLVAQQCRELNLDWRAIILEPVPRSSAPAIGLAAQCALAADANAILLVLSSDHLVDDEQAFAAAVQLACQGAEQGGVVTFGVKPTRPETAFGYIELESTRADGGLQSVKSFEEKPDLEKAQRYVTSGRHLWNSGMFVVRAQTFVDELATHNPEMNSATERAMAEAKNDLDFIRPSKAFLATPSLSVDYAVMEKTAHAMVVPVDFAWNDVGSWTAVWDESPRDDAGNHFRGDVVDVDTRDSLVFASERLVGTLGVEDLVVVETADAVLVADRHRVHEVRDLVKRLRERRSSEYLHHQEVFRPWGSYDGVAQGDSYQVKCIRVRPGERLSLQLHHHRSEHWVVVSGTAQVTRDNEVFTLQANESTFIPPGVKHRLENPGKIPLELIEVQVGSYLGEDDIERFDDNYGRLPRDE